jgi:hypothetical protein
MLCAAGDIVSITLAPPTVSRKPIKVYGRVRLTNNEHGLAERRRKRAHVLSR